uniref:Uncharacterized protein n=1 Tax=Rhizophora mucronata TaxID=61149 RepID=A0A2P2LS47_RHIMU
MNQHNTLSSLQFCCRQHQPPYVTNQKVEEYQIRENQTRFRSDPPNRKTRA